MGGAGFAETLSHLSRFLFTGRAGRPVGCLERGGEAGKKPDQRAAGEDRRVLIPSATIAHIAPGLGLVSSPEPEGEKRKSKRKGQVSKGTPQEGSSQLTAPCRQFQQNSRVGPVSRYAHC